MKVDFTNNKRKAKPMKLLSVKEAIYKSIKEKLLKVEIEPGSRIREDLLAEELSVSRTPVREAINQLAAEGFVEIIPRKGTFFVELTHNDILELLDVREALEALAVRKCIDKINSEYLKELENNIDQFEKALQEARYEECNVLDSKFHQKIAEITENSKLIEFTHIIEDFMRIARNMEMVKGGKTKNVVALKDHKQILEAIRSKDKDMAEFAARNNIHNMKKNLGI